MSAAHEERAELQGAALEHAVQEAASDPSSAAAPPRRERRRRKRLRFGLPERTAIAVKPLWDLASDKEKEVAHRYAMAILRTWTGRASWKEIAAELELPLVRVHQLSQQAVSGMMAGLLVQPRTRKGRKGGEQSGPPLRLLVQPEDDPVALRRRIAELEVKLSRTEDLVRVLQELPWNRAAQRRDEEAPRGKKPVEKPKRKRAAARPGPEPGAEARARAAREDAPTEGA